MPNEFDADTYDASLGRVEYWKHHVEGWLTASLTLPRFSYEQMQRELPGCLQRIARGANATVREGIISVARKSGGENLRTGWWRERWLRIRHLLGQPRYTSVAFRKGKIGDYKTWFSPEDLEWFESIAGTAMDRLGYGARP